MSNAVTQAADGAAVRVRLRLFGALRDVGGEPELTIEVPPGTTVAGVRGHLKEALARRRAAFAGGDLVDASAIASDTELLADGHLLVGTDVSLAILPPVCGG